MKRRAFLAAGVAVSTSLAVRTLRAQPAANRAAIVIGVDKVGSLPRLRAARSGARSVATWLREEGFEVKLFVDDPNPVRASDLFSAINSFVQAGTLDQLVVYFAGHGFISGTLSEFWMLSEAPDNPNEAVSLTESCRFAEGSGIANVVFISDACRSRADSISAEQMHGSIVFPARTNSDITTDVDQFLATRVGTAAYEVSVAQSAAAFEGIYTSCFLEAFQHPYSSMVEVVGGQQVVPNRRLKAYLAAEVPRKAQALSITLEQRPDSKVYSDEPTYIGRVSSASRATAMIPPPTIADVAGSAIAIASPGTAPPPPEAVMALTTTSGFAAAQERIVQARGLAGQLSARSGFTISGRKVESVVARPGIATKFTNLAGRDRPTALVEVDVRDARAASVAVRFGDGTGTVVAALDQYVGNVVVGETGVSNVSYVPSSQNPMRSAYESESGRLDQLRAAVATAAQFGVFRFDGPKEARRTAARQMADRIRMLKGIDPTLGVYAAYAYDDAGLPDKVHSVRSYMRGDLGTDLFDVGMLAGTLTGRTPTGKGPDGVVPCCPMLSQGWGLFRVKDVRMPDVLIAARDHLRVSLWLTLDPTGMQMLERALHDGGLW